MECSQPLGPGWSAPAATKRPPLPAAPEPKNNMDGVAERLGGLEVWGPAGTRKYIVFDVVNVSKTGIHKAHHYILTNLILKIRQAGRFAWSIHQERGYAHRTPKLPLKDKHTHEV